MKSRTYLILLFVAFASISALATAFEPEVVATNSKLASFMEAFYPPQVLNVTDGVYVARGYNRDNPVLIEGTDGLIVIDPGESIIAAEIRAMTPDGPSLRFNGVGLLAICLPPLLLKTVWT